MMENMALEPPNTTTLDVCSRSIFRAQSACSRDMRAKKETSGFKRTEYSAPRHQAPSPVSRSRMARRGTSFLESKVNERVVFCGRQQHSQHDQDRENCRPEQEPVRLMASCHREPFQGLNRGGQDQKESQN